MELLGPSKYFNRLERRTRQLQADVSSLRNTIHAQAGQARPTKAEVGANEEQLRRAEARLENTDQHVRKVAVKIRRLELQERLVRESQTEGQARKSELEEIKRKKESLRAQIPSDQRSLLAEAQKLVLQQERLKDEQLKVRQEQDLHFTSIFSPDSTAQQIASTSLTPSRARPLIDSSTLRPGDTPLNAYKDSRIARRSLLSAGTDRADVYQPWAILEKPPYPEDLTLPLLLANQTHLGHATALWHPGNSSYIFGIRDGIHVISLEITLSYLRRAAKVVQEVARRGGIILFVGTRKGHREVVVNSAKLAEPAYHIFSRWIPGSLTNGQQILGDCALKVVNPSDNELDQYRKALSNSTHAALRPDLVICLNPLENEVCLHECGLYNVPTIGIVDTDCNPSWVTYPIPANDDSLRSVTLISGVLARAAQRGQRLRMDAASEGKTTYNTRRVLKALKGMEEIANLDVQEKGRGDRDKGKDKDVD